MKERTCTFQARVYLEERYSLYLLQTALLDCFHELVPSPLPEPIFLCIGSDRSTGDSLGPLVGARLKKSTPFSVYGNLSSPVHASNLEEKLYHIHKNHTRAFIIAVDAGLGPTHKVGSILVKEGPLYPGTGVNKKLPPVGHMQVTGLVNVGGFSEYMVLQSTRLHLVMEMAQVMGRALSSATRIYFSPRG